MSEVTDRNWKWNNHEVIAVLVLGLAVGVYIGYSGVVNKPIDPRLEAVHVLLRNVDATCKAHPDVIEEANRRLPDNIRGQITPADIRKVVNDVVNRC